MTVEAESQCFTEFWAAHFSGQAPAGFDLREAFPERWIRFHSLPCNKRYAETETEWAILLERNIKLANEVLGSGSKCWLVISRSVDPSEQKEDQHLAQFDLKHSFDWRLEGPPGFHHKYPAFVASVRWENGCFNALLREVASSKEAPVIIASQHSGAIFAPYDGGIDLILPCEEDIVALRSKFAAWLPTTPSGL